MSNSLSGKTVLVTGADGFIGSHLVERLVALGAQVRALVYYNSWNSVGWLADCGDGVLDGVEIFLGDVREESRIRDAVAGVSHVFHLSSLIAIPYSYDAPGAYVDTNINGALNVLQACRASDMIERLIHVSTSEVYGSAQTVPISEDHPLVGQSPYSATKIGADALAESFHRSFGLPVVIARPFNTYGPRQTARAVIPTIAAQLIAGAPELTLGALTPTRDFNFVTDTVNGMIALATCDQAVGRTVNIGSGREWSIQETAELLMKISGRTIPIVCDEARLRPSKSEVNRLLADIGLIQELTGWAPEVTFEEGLKRTVDWISRNLPHFDAGTYAK